MTNMTDNTITVRNPDDMGPDIFRKHMDHRHSESLGGYRSLPPFPSDYVEECWRTFHDTLHRLAIYDTTDHDHGR